MSSRVWEIYDARSGERIASGYTRREARQAINWCWNTGGDVRHMRTRRDPTVPVPEYLRLAGLRLHQRPERR